MDLTAILDDVVVQLNEVRPSARWTVHRRPPKGNENWHPPAIFVDLRRISVDATLASNAINFDIDFIVGYLDGNDVNIDEFERCASMDVGSLLHTFSNATSEHWQHIIVSPNRFFRSDIVFGPNQGRGMTVNVDIIAT